MTLFIDLKKITLTPFDYNILEGNTKDTIVLQVYSDFQTPLVKNDQVVLADTDEAIDIWQDQGLPVIAWSHKNNPDESLMAAPWMILEPEALTEEYLSEVLCRHQGLPVTVCQTERCYLRELVMGDLEQLLSLDAEQEVDSAGRFFRFSTEDLTPSDKYSLENSNQKTLLEEYIRCQYPFYGYGIYAAFHRESNEFLGIAGFSAYETTEITEDNMTDIPRQEEAEDVIETLSVEIGYAVKKEYRRQGYAKEWLHGLTQWIKDYYKPDSVKIVARIQVGNEASIRTAKSCGIEIVYKIDIKKW